MASASEKFPGNKWCIGNPGAFAQRRNTAAAFRRLGAANSAVVTVARDEFFGAVLATTAPVAKSLFIFQAVNRACIY